MIISHSHSPSTKIISQRSPRLHLYWIKDFKVSRIVTRLHKSEKKYTLDLLAESDMMDCKLADMPIVVNHGIQITKGAQLADRERYQRLVGKLIYLSHTRLDIAYAVSVISQFMHQLQNNHLEVALRYVRYSKGPLIMELHS